MTVASDAASEVAGSRMLDAELSRKCNIIAGSG